MSQLIFEKQWLHALLLGVLLLLVGWSTRLDAVQQGDLWGVCSTTWLWIAAGLAVMHQTYVWFCWRTELHAKFLSRNLGSRGFEMYAIGFSIIGTLRVVAVFLLAIANQGSLLAPPVALKIAAFILVVPAIYLFYSVRRYFGFRRAFGIDHFEVSYRELPRVRRGIFRFTSNGMYVFGFFLLWVPGLWFASVAALVAALFNHLYIWVHYHATEKPDMKRIYGDLPTPETT